MYHSELRTCLRPATQSTRPSTKTRGVGGFLRRSNRTNQPLEVTPTESSPAGCSPMGRWCQVLRRAQLLARDARPDTITHHYAFHHAFSSAYHPDARRATDPRLLLSVNCSPFDFNRVQVHPPQHVYSRMPAVNMTRKTVSLQASRRNGRDSVVHYAGPGDRGVLCNTTWTRDTVAPDNRTEPFCRHCKRAAE